MFETERTIIFQPAATVGDVSSVSRGGPREYGVEEPDLGIQLPTRGALHISRKVVNWIVGNFSRSCRGLTGRHDWQLQRGKKSTNQEGDVFGGIGWHETSTSGDRGRVNDSVDKLAKRANDSVPTPGSSLHRGSETHRNMSGTVQTVESPDLQMPLYYSTSQS